MMDLRPPPPSYPQSHLFTPLATAEYLNDKQAIPGWSSWNHLAESSGDRQSSNEDNPTFVEMAPLLI